MAEFEKFLNIDYILSLFDSPNQMILILIIASLLIISILLLLFLFSSERKRLVLKKKFGHQARIMTSKLAQTEAVLASDEQLMMIWPSQDSMYDGLKLSAKKLREIGGLQNVIGMPKKIENVLQFENWIEENGVEKTNLALAALKDDGKPFAFFVKTKAVERVEMSGHVVGREIIFRIRDLKEDRLFLARANEKWTGLEKKVLQSDALLNISPLPIWLRDDDGKLIWVNAAYIQAVEAEDVSNVVQDNIELIAPADVYKARQYFMDDGKQNATAPDKDAEVAFKELDDGSIEQQVFAVIKGERCHLKIQHRKIDGGIVATAYDATKYERIKDELERYNHAHKQTLDKLKTAIAQFGPDQNLEFYNSSYQELFGINTEFLDSKPSMSMVLEEIRNLKKMPEQANFKSWRDQELDAFRQVEASDKWWHLPDGTNIHIIADPHPFGGVTFLYDDVTEHVALASKYNELDQIQTETLDNLSDGVAVFNSDGELQISNPAFAKIWQLEQEQLANKPHVNKVLDLCQVQSKENDVWAALKTSVTAIVDERQEVDGRIECDNDNVVDYASIPLPNSSTLMTFTDVTIVAKSSNLLYERNEALEAADQLKTDFISHVSYQFREPLTNILGFSEMLEGQVFGELNKKQLEYVDFIRSSSIGLRALINDILDLASLDADRMELRFDDIDVVELIANAVDAVKIPVEQKNIILNRIIMPHIGSFVGDEERVSQVLYNLLSNAIHFSDADSIVSIGAEKQKNRIRLWVRDAGAGISEENLAMVFDKFNSSQPTGAGLGLALVKKLVEFHGGEVQISSEVNKGTLVNCFLPIVQHKARTLPKDGDIVPQVEVGSNVTEVKVDDALMPIVSAFVAASEPEVEVPSLTIVPTSDEGDVDEVATIESKKPSALEQLKMLRDKNKKKNAELEKILKEDADERAVDAEKVSAEVSEKTDETPDDDDVKEKSIFENSRLTALYNRQNNDNKDDDA